jgi:hypothetical protein
LIFFQCFQRPSWITQSIGQKFRELFENICHYETQTTFYYIGHLLWCRVYAHLSCNNTCSSHSSGVLITGLDIAVAMQLFPSGSWIPQSGHRRLAPIVNHLNLLTPQIWWRYSLTVKHAEYSIVLTGQVTALRWLQFWSSCCHET